jgi:hypothetical protein
MDATIYALPMPIDICNIIISYINDIEQVHIGDTLLKYKYNDKLYDCYNELTMYIANDIIYTVTVYDGGFGLCIKNTYTGNHINMARSNKIFAIKYSNGLVCEYADNITIYDISNKSNLKIRCVKKFITPYVILLYADSQYIITKNLRSPGMDIYDTNFNLIKTIATDHTVFKIALINNILSYSMDTDWFTIEL